MNDLMNVETMGTYAGLLMATMLLTELFKNAFTVKGWNVRYLAYGIATILVMGFTWTGFYPRDLLLYVVNGAVVSLGAMGGSAVMGDVRDGRSVYDKQERIFNDQTIS